MAKRLGDSSDGTSHNIYLPPDEGGDDTHIAREYRSLFSGKSLPEALETLLSFSLGSMSPSVFYTVRDASEILGKAAVTVRKEARERQIGSRKGQGYLFNDQDIYRLSAGFEEKAARRRHPLEPPSQQLSVARALFERISQLSDIIDKLCRDRERFMLLFNTFFNELTAWRDTMEERIKRLEGR